MKDEKKTQLTQDPARSKMTEGVQPPQQEQPPHVAPPAVAPTEPTVRVKLVRDCLVNGEVQKAGTRHDVSEKEADRICREYPGMHDFFGALDGEERTPPPIVRGIRLEV